MVQSLLTEPDSWEALREELPGAARDRLPPKDIVRCSTQEGNDAAVAVENGNREADGLVSIYQRIYRATYIPSQSMYMKPRVPLRVSTSSCV